MKKILSTILILLSVLVGFSQSPVTLLSNGNMNGFNFTYSAPTNSVIRTNSTTGVTMSYTSGLPSNGTLDTLFFFPEGYDSIKVAVSFNRNVGGSVTFYSNGTSLTPTISPALTTFTYMISKPVNTVNPVTLTFSCNISNGSIFLTKLNITGYPTIMTGIKSTELMDNKNLFAFENKIFVNGDIKEGTKFVLIDLSGRAVITETDLLDENVVNLPSSVYIVKVFNKDKSLVTTKKVLIKN